MLWDKILQLFDHLEHRICLIHKHTSLVWYLYFTAGRAECEMCESVCFFALI